MRKRKDDDDGTETGRDEMDDLWQAKTVIKPDDQLQLTEQASHPRGGGFSLCVGYHAWYYFWWPGWEVVKEGSVCAKIKKRK